MKGLIRILIADDSEKDAEKLTELLKRAGYETFHRRVDSIEDLEQALNERGWDLFISDCSLSHFDMQSAFDLVKGSGLDIPFIVVSSTPGERAAVKAIKMGAHDFLPKSELSGFITVIQQELQKAGERRSLSRRVVDQKNSEVVTASAVLKPVENALRESEERFRGVLENSLDALYRRNYHTNTYEYMSPAITDITGYTPEEMVVKSVEEVSALLPPEDLKRINAELEALFSKGGGRIYMEYRFRHKNGQLRWAGDLATVFMDNEGKPVCGIGSVRDITALKEAAEQLEASLREKEALIRELYHRTKNNMQVICSLLVMQSANIDDEQTISILKDVECRIRSMALVHEKLYKSGNLSSINLGEYISELTTLLVKSYNISTDRISIRIYAENIFTLLDIAAPCGLMLNELITNVFKHAFPGDRCGEIVLMLHRDADGYLELTVSDNGVGVREDFDFHGQGRIGLKIIHAIGEEQLQGKVLFTSNNGLKCTVRFNDSHYSKRI
ncbi:MAG: sensor histidine kinase [Candidatus Xenobiia bacterium LiM19]